MALELYLSRGELLRSDEVIETIRSVLREARGEMCDMDLRFVKCEVRIDARAWVRDDCRSLLC